MLKMDRDFDPLPVDIRPICTAQITDRECQRIGIEQHLRMMPRDRIIADNYVVLRGPPEGRQPLIGQEFNYLFI